ncbi:MAG: hypothetical protein ACJ8BW_11550 [Ktedonobacteraceae bacterium]
MLAQQAGYQVIVASDCLTALKFLRSFKPDLMLLDERLLTRNRIDLLPRLHVMKDLQDIPLLLLSTDSPGSKWKDIPLTDGLCERVFQHAGLLCEAE